jgi:hypothetical protein
MMLEALNEYDWAEAFGFAGEKGTEAERWDGDADIDPCLPDVEMDTSPFGREDVEEIAGISEGENDEEDWRIYGRLKDGRWFYLEAWCDYTGWDCRAGGHVKIARTREECERYALTDRARQKFGLPTPTESP